MLKEVLRRLLWLGPTLLVVTLPLFWGISRTTDRTARTPPSTLPLFFNASPEGVRERSLAAVSAVASGGPRSTEAAAELVRLGGAAFPYVLTEFDSLAPDARGRVALALAPVARRMGIGSDAELDDPEIAVLLMSRFWEEHAIDFRPAVVRRTVRRFVEHPSALRASEVTELDTVALEDLVDAFGTVKTPEDATRVRHLADVTAHVTEHPWTVAPGASVDVAAAVAARWKRWWAVEQSSYVAFTGPRRLGATVLETRYGHWLEHLASRGGNAPASGKMAGELRVHGAVTLTLLAAAFFLGYPLAVLGGTAAAALRGRRSRRFSLSATALFFATLGVAGTALVTTRALGHGLVSACVTIALATAAMSLRHQKTLSERVFELSHVRTELAFGASRARVAVRSMRLTMASVAALAVADLPGLFTSALVVEHVYSLRGIGATTVEALRNGDQAWLLTVAVLGTLTVALAQMAADLLLIALDPRVRRASRRVAKSLG
ncbi:MAG TPA: ABC transporter permease subunit [Polyangiaceae bacterium]|jgi:ABC-type dipeptide/oligopeptide/nickel transport system permease component|nr:ABC transporter permease subunit [Polyangiaceae bacterium]